MALLKIETGVNLFSRLNVRPSLENLNTYIFQNGGPFPQEVIEITGDVSTGKTQIITELIALVILPTEHNGTNIGGKNAGAILINTDHHFELFRLVAVMESIIKEKNWDNNIKTTDIEGIVKDSLRKLIILNVYDSQQLTLSIYSLDKILSENNNIPIVFIDSISAYYWSERDNSGIISMDQYQKQILDLIQSETLDYKAVIVFTKPNYFISKNTKRKSEMFAYSSKDNQLGKSDYKISLYKNGEKSNYFIAKIEIRQDTYITNYRISSKIEWLEVS